MQRIDKICPELSKKTRPVIDIDETCVLFSPCAITKFWEQMTRKIIGISIRPVVTETGVRGGGQLRPYSMKRVGRGRIEISNYRCFRAVGNIWPCIVPVHLSVDLCPQSSTTTLLAFVSGKYPVFCCIPFLKIVTHYHSPGSVSCIVQATSFLLFANK